jgi:hypothetical protein
MGYSNDNILSYVRIIPTTIKKVKSVEAINGYYAEDDPERTLTHILLSI